MRVCVFGAGAVGGHFAAKLGAAGHDVSVVVRGEALAAIRANGVVLHSGEAEIRARVAASDDPADLGPQDLVICTVKTMGLTGFAETAAPLLGPETPVVFAQNGIPWWYDIGLGADRPRPPDLTPLDPEGALSRAIAPERIIGGVIHSANELERPGVIRNNTPHRNHLTIGEPDDRASERTAEIRQQLEAAGIGSPVVEDVRAAVWRKLLLNMTASILCLITGHRATVVQDERIGPVFLRLAAEAVSVANAHGISTEGFDPEAARRNVPHHFPSIRQDYDRGKPLEVESLILVPVEFGRAAGVAIPCLEMLAALALRKARDVEEGLVRRD